MLGRDLPTTVFKLPAATTPVVNRSGPRFDPGGAEDSLGCAMAGSLLTKDANMVPLCGFFDTADPSSDVAAAAAVVAGAADDNLSAAVVACACATGAVVAAADEFSAAVLSAASDFSAGAAPAFMSPAAST